MRNLIEKNANWFAVEAKSFEITVEGAGKKTKYVITERRRGYVSWIRFGEEGLFYLLKNVEECLKAPTPVSRSLVWSEYGRFFRLECKENKDGRYLLCSAKDVEGKKHRLFFPEGRGFLNGWALLAAKLRGLGVKRQEEIPLSLIEAVLTEEDGKARNGPSKDSVPCGGPQVITEREEGYCNAVHTVWVDAGDCGSGKALGILQWCLIGKWKTGAGLIPGEKMVEIWGREMWRLNKGLRVATLNKELLFLEFESPEEAERVLESGRRYFRGRELQLERWNPYAGCIRSKGSAQEEWIRVIGLPPHMRKAEILKKIGDACGGFLAMDKSTELRTEMKWARILIKSKGAPRPSTVNILEGPRSYEFQIWWEVSPWVTDVYPVYARVAAKSSEEEEDGEARAGRRMGVGRPNFNKGRQQVMAGGTDAVGQPGLLEAERVRMGAEHLWRSRGKKIKGIGPDIRPVQATSGEGVAMRPVNDSVEGAGGRPLFIGSKMGPVNWAQSQKVMMGGRNFKMNEVGQQGVNLNKACLVGSGPDPSGPSSKAQKQFKRGPGRLYRDPEAELLGTKEVVKRSAGGMKRTDEGARPEEKGAAKLEALVDPAWICAKGPLRDAHEERTELKDCHRFEGCEKAGLWEMSSECSSLISASQGTTGSGSMSGQVLDSEGCGSRGFQVEDAEAYRNRNFGSRYEILSAHNCSPPLCSVFGRPLLHGGPSGLGKHLGYEVMGDIEPLRVVSADGIEWGETTSEDPTATILENQGCGDGRGEDPKTRMEGEGYEKWEDSCLIKFSEFLGIPTVGYDEEILELLRKMVSQPPGNKRKGLPTESRSERELRRLECTINYSGKDQNRGGRDRGNFLLKLK